MVLFNPSMFNKIIKNFERFVEFQIFLVALAGFKEV